MDDMLANGLNEQPRRGRPPRAERGASGDRHRRERRRDPDQGADGPELKLAIPTWVKEKYPEQEFVYRWFSGRQGRLQQAHSNDWDVVEGVEEVPATDKDGRPANHILHVKHRDWYDADRGHLEASRRETEKQMLRGKVSAKGDDAGDTLSQEHSYASESNRLA